MKHRGVVRRWRPSMGAALSAGALAVGLAIVPATAASADFIECGPAVNAVIWDGDQNDPPNTPSQTGDNQNFSDAYNWNTDCVPGSRVQTYNDDVTIPTGANVFLNSGESAHILALHNTGSLTLGTGSKLFTFADSESKTLTLNGTLGGTARFTVTGTLNWTSQPALGGAASQTTRECVLVPSPCESPLESSGKGTTVIAPGAALNISGGGVNLFDQRVIENHGVTRLYGAGYIAADDGTSFRNLRGPGESAPLFVIKNNGGYYQGFVKPALGLSSFTNSGRVIKNAGSGVSLIETAFSANDPGSSFVGTVAVLAGTLSILSERANQVRAARVQQGRTFGNGGCAGGGPAACKILRPFDADEQQTTVQLTASGTTLATVTIRELNLTAVAGQRGVPVQIDTPNASSSPDAPLRFRILLDRSLLDPDETPAQVASSSPVFRQATTADPYVALPDCDPLSGNPTLEQPSCVSRSLSGSETTTLGDGDVVIVVSSLQNSRYRVGGR